MIYLTNENDKLDIQLENYRRPFDDPNKGQMYNTPTFNRKMQVIVGGWTEKIENWRAVDKIEADSIIQNARALCDLLNAHNLSGQLLPYFHCTINIYENIVEVTGRTAAYKPRVGKYGICDDLVETLRGVADIAGYSVRFNYIDYRDNLDYFNVIFYTNWSGTAV